MTCFIDDPTGLKLIDDVGLDMVTWECDYPHSDSAWPHAPEVFMKSIGDLSDDAINKITHVNAMREFQFDPFAHRPKVQCPEIVRVHRRRGPLEQGPRRRGLGKCDHVAERRRPRQQHGDPIEPQREATMRRRPRRQAVEQEAEPPPDLRLRETEQLEDSAERELPKLAECDECAGLDVEELVVHGEAASEIVRVAKERDVDLIVIASHGRTGLGRILFGSTAESVVRHASCPVLVVKPRQEEEPED